MDISGAFFVSNIRIFQAGEWTENVDIVQACVYGSTITIFRESPSKGIMAIVAGTYVSSTKHLQDKWQEFATSPEICNEAPSMREVMELFVEWVRTHSL